MSKDRSRVGQAWSEKDDAELRRLLSARQRAGVIASALGRTVDAIRGRAAALRLALPSSQRPWRHFPGRNVLPATGDTEEPPLNLPAPITGRSAKLDGPNYPAAQNVDRPDEGNQDG